ncbi:hypothetical protein SUGI_1060850 [Cryptomeria japonica]|uniref:subtilisin-like protease SBT1.7 n=1 Tax=Cryptomeria japonica TaxID=3369 RepID=UPI002414BCFA|nr:subtilisin-like protease SBT1.7 [Cryptomeria japonica]GLJ49904.1 hypothetical protein SUGI_1060850 [Cryptomeria japonica]
MADNGILFRLLLVCFMFTSYVTTKGADYASTYIICMDKSIKPNEFSTHEHWYKSLLSSVKSVTADQNTQSADFYHYTYDTVMQGFSALLTQSELDMLEEMPGHVLSFPDPEGNIHTTHSTEFLGLDPNSGLLPRSRFGQDVIIAILDTGIWPESPSFGDHGMEPVPARWKGKCVKGTHFDPSLCNKKLIGARFFNKANLAKYGTVDFSKDYDSPRDFAGHGSHTSSTAGGNYVEGVNSYGYAQGTARGVAPAARIAMYKVVWASASERAIGSDVLAGMESAINDGADVLSLSLGFDSVTPYFKDVIALGAFAAAKKGVLVVCAAGNDGPSRKTMYNAAPWIFTVGASTIDRTFKASLKLGDGTVVNGSSFYYSGSDPQKGATISSTPLRYDEGDPACNKKLEALKVNGSVLLCFNNTSRKIIDDAIAAGAVALVLVGVDTIGVTAYPDDTFPVAVFPPGDKGAVDAVLKYASLSDPVVGIQFGVTVLGFEPAPSVVEFSSRGPSFPSPNVLKPDVIAPGVNILAAWLPDTRGLNKYYIVSGTSMSCPHVAGISALVKAVHSDWSPAAIRSALMTTSYGVDNLNHTIGDLGRNGRPATPLDLGAGQVDAQRAIDPGLVYDLSVEDYVNFLCTLNYSAHQIQAMTGNEVLCSSDLDLGSDGLNYPSFTAIFRKNSASKSSTTFKRTITNVGDSVSYYKVVVEAPQGLKIEVNPSSLTFMEKFQKLNFSVTVEAEKNTRFEYGYLSWIDNNRHVVKSPVVVLFD